ncbi:BTAD domain-containing putative transcriptional regulator [Streptomyces sp. NPDC006333]|uniref:BTAD domain-containing putative transcriptional regulator n=1 Tax=Streptomyces sp. NPDC006333 TaxID=3156753 RepID=UPI0033AAD200
MQRDTLREGWLSPCLSALAGCGRRAEALAAYSDTHKLPAKDLGMRRAPRPRAVHRTFGKDPEMPFIAQHSGEIGMITQVQHLFQRGRYHWP